MKKLYVEEMTKEQLTKVLEANYKLQNEVYSDMIDSEMYWVSEQLDYIRKYLSDWSIGPDSRNYITVKDEDGFINGLIEMDNGIPLFSDADKEIIYRVAEQRDKFYDMSEDYMEDEPEWDDFETEEEFDKAMEEYDEAVDKHEEAYAKAEEAFEEAVRELAYEVASKFEGIFDYCYNSEAQLDYFLEFYRDERMVRGTFYINEEDDSFELFEDVAYTKSLK